jgi:hypothetical protein
MDHNKLVDRCSSELSNSRIPCPLFFFAVEENALIWKHYTKVPNKHKNTAQPNCKLTMSSTHRCRRWRAVAAASLEALDQRQSPASGKSPIAGPGGPTPESAAVDDPNRRIFF